MKRNVLIQLLTDPENQPHQFVGNAEALDAQIKACGDRAEQCQQDTVAIPRSVLKTFGEFVRSLNWALSSDAIIPFSVDEIEQMLKPYAEQQLEKENG